MKRRKLDRWRYVPLGMNADTVFRRMWLGFAGAMACSILPFLCRYCSARSRLWGYYNGKYGRMPGYMMMRFPELMQGLLWGPGVACLLYAILGAVFYGYHYQGSRSVYTMRRLPDKWELWRRCLTAPGLFLALTVAASLVLTGIYYLVWRYCTPLDALPI